MKLRYYTSPRAYLMKNLFYVLELLRQVDEHVMPVEIVDDRGEEDIYENDMKPQTRTIKKNTGRTAADQLKARSGNLHVHGTLAIVEDGAVQWVKRRDIDETLELLLANEDEALDELIEEVQESPKTEQDVINAFVQADVLDGAFEHEVEVGINQLEAQLEAGNLSHGDFNMRRTLVSRRIDIVCNTDTVTWVIEAKEELDIKAVGQILVYAELYQEDHPGVDEVRTAVISGPPTSYADQYKFGQLEAVLESYGVEVFVEDRDF